MTEEQTTPESAPQPTAKSKREHRTKLVFLALLIVVVAVIFWFQRQGPTLKGWQDDLPAALKQAGAEGRPLVVFCMEGNATEGSDTQRMITLSLQTSMVAQSIAERKFIPVAITLDRSLQSPIAKDYQVKGLPTLLILSPAGKLLESKQGFAGHAEVQQMLVRNSPKP